MTDYTCQDVIDLLVEYTDGALPDDVRTRLDEHFAGCASCAEFLRAYRAVPKLFREHTDVDMPDETRAELQRILAARKKPP